MTTITEQKMTLRSSISAEEREALNKAKKDEEEQNRNRPLLIYNGKIQYIREFIDCAIICDKLIENLEATEDILVVGFDVEWPFSFKTGAGKAALIQISPNLESCILIQVSDLHSIPKSLAVLLAHPKIRITGVNIKNDIRKLARDFAGFDGDTIIKNCIDSGVLANTILPFQQRWSMERLVKYLLKKSINKDKKVRMSKWHISPLSQEQLIYAATDAYASLLLYNELKKREDTETK